MTLFKQVALLVTLVFSMIIITTIVGDIKRSSILFEGQMQTSARDMATMLGIAISNSAEDPDAAIYETLFNAVFDSGYYSSITLVTAEGEIIHRKQRDLEVQGVPDWFISIVKLNSATGTTQVMRGWVPLGMLQLTLHPGYVYASLYKNLEANLIWFLVFFIGGMIVLWVLLHEILKPLTKVKEQADAIHKNVFVKQESLPATIELRSVVEAMNRMIDKVHAIFDDQEDTLKRYQKLRFEDSLTGLGNRRYFMSQLERVQSEETDFHGSMVVIKVNNLDHIRDNFGYENSDKVLKALAAIFKSASGRNASEYCARLADDEFALLVHVGARGVIEYVESIFSRFQDHSDLVRLKDDVSLTAGIADVKIGESAGSTLAQTDFALTQAAVGGPYSVKATISTNIALPQGKIQWRTLLERCIKENKFFLVQQRVDCGGSVFHHEVFVRLRNDEGDIVPAGMFMPMAKALELDEKIDCAVFKMVKKLYQRRDTVPVAVNLTESVFVHVDALVEFNQLIKFFQESNMSLNVEVSHTILEQYTAMCVEVADLVREAGMKFGVDNLNPGRSLQALQLVRPDYVKVNAKTLYDMSQVEASVGYQALRTLTRTMDIKLIAVAVGSQELHDHLEVLDVDGMQGNLLARPEEIQ